ncbi:hypothetical protein SDC9_182756 [bioreactor metagenome]|uniref:Uncharacterized protein n=1 Tax=bioreactor metagenome TaxID=1076179 RepID=A0A645HAV7_9ZZZZ
MPFFQQATHHSPEIEGIPILLNKTAKDRLERPTMGTDRVRYVVKSDCFFGMRKSDQFQFIIISSPTNACC